MFKGIKYKIQITEFLFVSIIITLFSSCARERNQNEFVATVRL